MAERFRRSRFPIISWSGRAHVGHPLTSDTDGGDAQFTWGSQGSGEGQLTGAGRRRSELPDTWECKFDGSAAKLVGGAEPAPKKVKPPRTHWDMLLERRSVEDLEEVLAERLEVLRGRRTRAS